MCGPGHARDVVEDLEVVLVGDERLIAIGPETSRAAVLEHDLAERRRRVIQVHAGNADALREILAVVDRRHEELDLRPAEAELVEPFPRPEGVGVVERESLRLDVAVTGAEGEASVTVLQRRRQEAVRLLVAVADEETVVAAEIVIDFRVDLIVVAFERGIDQIVVDGLSCRAALTGSVWRWIELLDDAARRGVPPIQRNLVVGKGLSRQRVVNDTGHFTEIAPPHAFGGHGRQEGLPLAHAIALIAAEEEGLRPQHGPAERAAKLMLAEVGRFAAGALVEKVVGVERVVAEELVGVALEGVRPGFDLDVHDAAERSAELRRIGAGLQLELVQRIDGGEDDDGLQPRFVVVDAVQDVVVVARALTVGREGCRGTPRQAARAVDVRARDAAHHARHGAREAHEVSTVERQLPDLLFADGRAELGRRGLDERRDADDGHGFGDGADLELHGEAEALINAEADAWDGDRLEPLKLGQERVGAGGKRWCRELAGRVGDDDSRAAGFGVSQGDGCAGKDPARIVGDGSEDRPGHRLRCQQPREQDRHDHKSQCAVLHVPSAAAERGVPVEVDETKSSAAGDLDVDRPGVYGGLVRGAND